MSHPEPRIGRPRDDARQRAGDLGERRSDLIGIGMAATSAALLGTMVVIAKFAYDVGARPVPLLAARFLLSSLVLFLFHIVTRRRLLVGRAKVMKLFALGVVGYAIASILLFAAAERAPAGVASLVFYSFPMWTALIAFTARLEPLRARTVVALALGSAGVLLVFALPRGGLIGPLFALGAAVAIATFLILMQLVLDEGDGSAAAFWTNLGAALTVNVVALIGGEGAPVEAIPYAALLGIISSVAFVILYGAIPRIGSARASVASMVEPVTTVTLAAILLGEELTLRVVAGALLIVSALPLLALRRKAAEVQPTPIA